MREIKFRAWDKACERMVNPERHVNNWRLHMDGTSSINDVWATSDLILMQFTGLQDVNGVDIYEGDIVCIVKDRFGEGRDEVWSVEYGYFGDAAFYVQNHLNSGRLIEVEQHPCFYPDGEAKVILEVIGNIHENPELTK